MTILDLTMDFHGERFPAEIKREEMPLQSGLTKYTGIIYTITHDGMSGTYIDFPGHIAETECGRIRFRWRIFTGFRPRCCGCTANPVPGQ